MFLLMNDTFFARAFTFLVKSITHNELMVAKENFCEPQGVLFLEAVGTHLHF